MSTPRAAPAAPARSLRVGQAEAYVGTCSWTRGFEHWYPDRARHSSAGRLRHYASHFPTVEIDATYYSLLAPQQALRFAASTRPGFLFGVKAFRPAHRPPGRSCPPALPHPSHAPPRRRLRQRVRPRDLPAETLDACWAEFSAFLAGLEAHGKLGYALFPFPRWTEYSPGVLRYHEEVRERLAGRPVAVEWRHRSWLEGKARQEMGRALRELGIVNASLKLTHHRQLGIDPPPGVLT